MELPDIEFDASFLKELAKVGDVQGGVMIVGDAAEYGLVWEWGNLRQKKQGPRTVKGTNPSGKRRWMSSQAPRGWIRVNEAAMDAVVNRAIRDMDLDKDTAAEIKKEMTRTAKRVSKAIVEILQETAPIGSREFGDPHPGLLRRSLKAVEPDDSILRREADGFDALELGED